MELRVLHYFLAVAREQSISAAAQSPAPHPAHPLPADYGAGGGAGQAPDDPGQPEDHPHRGGHAAAQAGGGDYGAGEPHGAGGGPVRRDGQRGCPTSAPGRPTGCASLPGRQDGCRAAARRPLSHCQRRRGGCAGARGQGPAGFRRAPGGYRPEPGTTTSSCPCGTPGGCCCAGTAPWPGRRPSLPGICGTSPSSSPGRRTTRAACTAGWGGSPGSCTWWPPTT